MQGVLDTGRNNDVNNNVISSLLTTAGGIPGIAAMLRNSQLESQLLGVYLTNDGASDFALLSSLLGVEPLISEQEYV